jgi:hypothetical protein
VSWDSPAAGTGEACLQNPTGYKIYAGTTMGIYSITQTLPFNSLSCTPTGQTSSCGAVHTCTYTSQSLAVGTWYFTVTAYDSIGAESASSNVLSLTVN